MRLKHALMRWKIDRKVIIMKTEYEIKFDGAVIGFKATRVYIEERIKLRSLLGKNEKDEAVIKALEDVLEILNMAGALFLDEPAQAAREQTKEPVEEGVE